MIKSKLINNAQTTIPESVRVALRSKEGDGIAYIVEPDRVVMTRVAAQPTEDPFGRFEEWASEADRHAYAKL